MRAKKSKIKEKLFVILQKIHLIFLVKKKKHVTYHEKSLFFSHTSYNNQRHCNRTWFSKEDLNKKKKKTQNNRNILQQPIKNSNKNSTNF